MLLLLLLLLLLRLLYPLIDSFLDRLCHIELPEFSVAVRALVDDISASLQATWDETAKPAPTAEHHETAYPSLLAW